MSVTNSAGERVDVRDRSPDAYALLLETDHLKSHHRRWRKKARDVLSEAGWSKSELAVAIPAGDSGRPRKNLSVRHALNQDAWSRLRRDFAKSDPFKNKLVAMGYLSIVCEWQQVEIALAFGHHKFHTCRLMGRCHEIFAKFLSRPRPQMIELPGVEYSKLAAPIQIRRNKRDSFSLAA